MVKIVTTISSNTFIKDTVIFTRDFLDSNVTDPISGSRSPAQFVFTSYPKKNVVYPIITVQNVNIEDGGNLGMQSELHLALLTIEVRVWARNTKERDEMAQSVIELLRANQFPFTSGTSEFAQLINFRVGSAINVNAGVEGEEVVRSKIIIFEYQYILGQS